MGYLFARTCECRMTCGLRNFENLRQPKHNKQQAGLLAGLSCPGSSVVAEGTNDEDEN